jgi:secretion/DNA translocation related TadE-like protein
VGAIAALCLLAVAVLAYGGAVLTRHRAVAAADLAALAAAAYVPDGAAAACDRARWVAAGMEVAVTGCRISGWDALVQVGATLPIGLGAFGTVSAHSRAGPSPR